ncbi:N-acetylneuraminate synthase family protein [Phycisphaerales bacterium]|nr:N-acetylneuraminate synthase family protein [Phycisphaerales bacterium]RPG16396.1 MAG: N-acetylneuraminate synthase [Phycisphaera sp. TMED9]
MRKSELRIGERSIGAGAPTYIIAEIGVNHDGSVERGLELIEAAAGAGVDAVKFQWFEADRLVGDPTAVAAYQRRSKIDDQRTMLRSLEIDATGMERFIRASHEAGLDALVTVFSVELVRAARSLAWDAWKTASPDLVHRPLLEALADDGRPMLISTGAADLEEVRRTDQWFPDASIAFLHCVSAYPTPESEASLGAIGSIADATGRPVGYSDHTTLETTGGLAVAAGARLLEKHLTWNRNAEGPDHAVSLDPKGLARFVDFSRRAGKALGSGEKKSAAIESDVRRVARQSVRAARELRPGVVLAASDLAVKRPADGLEPWRLDEIVGRTLRTSLEPDAPIREEDLA